MKFAFFMKHRLSHAVQIRSGCHVPVGQTVQGLRSGRVVGRRRDERGGDRDQVQADETVSARAGQAAVSAVLARVRVRHGGRGQRHQGVQGPLHGKPKAELVQR